MQNYILSNIRTCIPYIKELRNIAGSVTASILMQQLDYILFFIKKYIFCLDFVNTLLIIYLQF